jgi:hypothetical protein
MKLDYIQRLTLGIAIAKKKLPTGVYATEISHDDWCEFYKGKSKKCSCIPDIKITIDDKKFYIDEEGVIHERSN